MRWMNGENNSHLLKKLRLNFLPQAGRIAQVVRVQGIIISASKTRLKASKIALRCGKCGDTTRVEPRSGLGGITYPRQCSRPNEGGTYTCGLDPYTIIPDDSEFVDQQTLKLQERPEDVPTGEMPRNSLLLVERNMVSRVVPGKRVVITGIYSTFQQKVSSIPSN
eukprot:TRINITY_DN2118_c0_g2_i3.p1 TRINITY_DN2118_c0_g2~~TRINITY_DN2118_c0_g2_i3.p1  ORF type:complete len:165 (-),score=38.29 TRINITY_DN2118_c0_g2_i3:32-526(-)